MAYVEDSPVIDGRLDDTVWEQAVVVDDFLHVALLTAAPLVVATVDFLAKVCP